jgi:hypothetical protein
LKCKSVTESPPHDNGYNPSEESNNKRLSQVAANHDYVRFTQMVNVMCVTPTIYLDFCSYRDEQYLGDTEANVPLRSEHWHQTIENDINQ